MLFILKKPVENQSRKSKPQEYTHGFSNREPLVCGALCSLSVDLTLGLNTYRHMENMEIKQNAVWHGFKSVESHSEKRGWPFLATCMLSKKGHLWIVQVWDNPSSGTYQPGFLTSYDPWDDQGSLVAKVLRHPSVRLPRDRRHRRHRTRPAVSCCADLLALESRIWRRNSLQWWVIRVPCHGWIPWTHMTHMIGEPSKRGVSWVSVTVYGYCWS